MAVERGDIYRPARAKEFSSIGQPRLTHLFPDMSAPDSIDSSLSVHLQELPPLLPPASPHTPEKWSTDDIELTSERSLEEEMRDIAPYLLPNERVKSIFRVQAPSPVDKLSPAEALMKLGSVSSEEELGLYPLKAAVADENSQHIEEFRRFEMLFGRDSLVTGLILSDIYPQLARRNILKLGEKQGTKYVTGSEEELGKIIHQDSPPDDKDRGWEFPYYGSFDATPLYIKGVMKEVMRDESFLHTRIPNTDRTVEDTLFAAVEYQTRKQDESMANGLIFNARMNPRGIENQNWKDSRTSLSRKDGSLPDFDAPKAYLEVQVYSYDGFLDMAEYYSDKNPELAADLTRRADLLRDQILEKFWIEDERGGYFAPALERVKDENGATILKPFEIRTSNMGHTLWSRLLKGDDTEITYKREAILRTLHGPDMRNISGFRSLSSNEVRFKPTAYHNGNVWFWDSMWIALGEKELGYEALARQDMFDIFRAVTASGMMPEFGKGSSSLKPEVNEREVKAIIDGEEEDLIEQVPQQLQLWTAAAMRRIEEEMKSWKSDVSATPIEKECLELMRHGIIDQLNEHRFAAD